jgi:hypothetical protein
MMLDRDLHLGRYRWEKLVALPLLDGDQPDMRFCLLHQKLQMLNYCIRRWDGRPPPERLARRQACAELDVWGLCGCRQAQVNEQRAHTPLAVR